MRRRSNLQPEEKLYDQVTAVGIGVAPVDPPRTDAQFAIIEQENDHYRPWRDKNLIRRIKQRLARVEGGNVSPEFQFLSLGETRALLKLFGIS